MSRVKDTIFLMSKLGNDPSSKYGHFDIHIHIHVHVHGHSDIVSKLELCSTIHTKLEFVAK